MTEKFVPYLEFVVVFENQRCGYVSLGQRSCRQQIRNLDELMVILEAVVSYAIFAPMESNWEV